jgi:hypothetical protein
LRWLSGGLTGVYAVNTGHFRPENPGNWVLIEIHMAVQGNLFATIEPFEELRFYNVLKRPYMIILGV